MPGARNKQPWIPSVLPFPSNLQTGHKGFSVPSLNRISHSDVLPVWGSISYFHLVLSFPVWASKFVCVQVSHIFLFLNRFSLQETISLSHSPFILLPVCVYLAVFIIVVVSIYFSSPGSYFFISGPYFLSLSLRFPSRCPLTKHPLPTPSLEQPQHFPPAWSRKDRTGTGEVADRTREGAQPARLVPAASCTGRTCPSPSKRPAQGREAEGSGGEAFGAATADAVLKHRPVSVRLRHDSAGLCSQRRAAGLSLPPSRARPLRNPKPKVCGGPDRFHLTLNYFQTTCGRCSSRPPAQTLPPDSALTQPHPWHLLFVKYFQICL